MDDRTLLFEIGEALYGQNWKTQVAGELSIDDRSLRRWIQSGEVPPGVWCELRTLLARRKAAITKLQSHLDNKV